MNNHLVYFLKSTITTTTTTILLLKQFIDCTITLFLQLKFCFEVGFFFLNFDYILMKRLI